jgi:hypothetical protein
MRRAVLLALGIASGVGLTGGCIGEPLHIDRQITLSPGHRVMPHSITRASNGDMFVIGSSDEMDYRAWATRLTPSGEVRWEYLEGGPDEVNDRRTRPQRFYGAVELPDETTLLCGSKIVEKWQTVMLVRLDKGGKLLSETLLPPVRDNVVISLYSCHKHSDGIVLLGSVSGQPAGTAWMAKLDWDFNLQWKKFSDDFGLGEFIETGDALIALGWHGQEEYLVKIGPDGNIIAKHVLRKDDGEHHLMQRIATDPKVRIVTFISNGRTEIANFDDQLRGPMQTLELHNVGVKKSLGLPDGSMVIVGSKNTSFVAAYPSAAVTRVARDGSYRTFPVEPLHQLPWYIDAVATGNGNQIAAVRQVGIEQGMVDFLSFK